MRKLLFWGCWMMLVLAACTKDAELPKHNEEPITEMRVVKSVWNDITAHDVEARVNAFLVTLDGKYGLIDQKANLLIDVKYEQLWQTNDGSYLGKTETGFELLRDWNVDPLFSKVLSQLEKDYDAYDYDSIIGLWKVQKGGKYAYLRIDGSPFSGHWYDAVSPVYLLADGDIPYYAASNLFATYQEEDGTEYCNLHALDGTLIAGMQPKHTWDAKLQRCNVYGVVDMTASQTSGKRSVYAVIVNNEIDQTIYAIDGTMLADHVQEVMQSYGESFFTYFKDGKTYTIDMITGKVALEAEHTAGYRVVKQDNSYGIQLDGAMLVPYQYESIQASRSDYNKNTKYFIGKRNTEYDVIDLQGNVLFTAAHDRINSTADPNIWIQDDSKLGKQLLDGTGKPLTNYEISNVTVGSLIAIVTEGRYEVLDKNLTKIYTGQFVNDMPLILYNEAFLALEQDVLYVKDKNAQTLGEYVDLKHDILIYKRDRNYYAMGNNQEVLLDRYDPEQMRVYTIQGIQGIFLAHHEVVQFVDEKLNPYLQVKADAVIPIGEVTLENGQTYQYFAAEKNGKYALMLESGEILSDFIYDEYRPFSNHGYAAVRQGPNWAVINYRGQLTTAFIYSNEDTMFLRNTYTLIGPWHLRHSENPTYDRDSFIHTRK